jgi:hypothetical protein
MEKDKLGIGHAVLADNTRLAVYIIPQDAKDIVDMAKVDFPEVRFEIEGPRN